MRALTLTTALINPATGEEFARAPVSSPADVDAALQAAQRAFGGWRDTTPKERSLALLKIADALERRLRNSLRSNARTPASRSRSPRSEEIPQLIDPVRFFAGCARILEGTSAGEYITGPHVDDPPRTCGCLRAGHALELPDADGGLEVGAGDRRG